jgi:hypothetical protein
MTGTTQETSQRGQLDWVHATITDLQYRANALRNLIHTTHTWRVDLNDCDLDADGAPTAITVVCDRDAWFTAVAVATAPRPVFPAANN